MHCIYTIGRESAYKKAFLEAGHIIKIGRRDDIGGKPYPGGIVFRKPDKAARFIRKSSEYSSNEFVVLRVWSSWYNTYTAEKGTQHLLNDAPIALPMSWMREEAAGRHFATCYARIRCRCGWVGYSYWPSYVEKLQCPQCLGFIPAPNIVEDVVCACGGR